MSSMRKYKKIRDHIVELIETKTLAPGQRLPTDTQLVEEFGVSRPTIARAMNELVLSGLVERRAGAGSFVARKKNVEPLRQVKTLGLLIPGLGETEIFEPICSEIASLCERHHFSLLWGNVPPRQGLSPAEKAMALCKKYIEDNVAGVFWAPLELSDEMEDVNTHIADMLDESGMSVVMLDRDYLPYPYRSQFDLVGIDNVRAGYLQAVHLIGHGMKRIVYFAHRQSASTVIQRIHGFRLAKMTALEQRKNTFPNESDTVFGDPSEGAAVDELLSLTPEAVICANDITAATLMRSLLDRGIKIPAEIRVMGLDDVRYSSFFSVSLTTLHQPCRAIGAAAVNAMAFRVSNRQAPPQEIHLNCTLKIRESCGCQSKTMT